MDKEIVDKFKLTKKDCDKLISLIDFIEESRKRSQDMFEAFSYIRIPLNILGASGFTIPDIKKLSDVLGQRIFIDNNQLSPTENPNNDLLLRRIASNYAKERIELLKSYIKDEPIVSQGKVKKDDKPKVLIDLRGLIFFKEEPKNVMKVSDKKLELLRVLSNKKPKTMARIAEEVNYREERRVSTAIKEINDNFQEKFGQDNNLIIPAGSGYCFNNFIFSLSFLK